jgi:hypothetical protein
VIQPNKVVRGGRGLPPRHSTLLDWRNVKKTIAVLGLILICTSAHALDIDPFKGPKPIAVLVQTDPWLMVIGSDIPRIALYDDGQIVFLKKDKNKRQVFFHKRLSADELASIKKKISAFGDYSKLKRHYDIISVTDQPETKIYLDLNRPAFVTSVYGLRVSGTKHPPDSFSGDEQQQDGLPKAIRDLHAYMTSLDFADATPWEPLYIEVMIWGYEYAPEESIHWPKEWPGLESTSTLKRGNSYSIFLPGNQFPKLLDFLKTQKEKGAVEIGGKKWAVSFRYTFPSEPVWFKAFRGNPEQQKPNKTDSQ